MLLDFEIVPPRSELVATESRLSVSPSGSLSLASRFDPVNVSWLPSSIAKLSVAATGARLSGGSGAVALVS